MTQNATLDRPVFRHPHEQFTWMDWEWDIARLQRDIDSGALRPKMQELNGDFIASYAQSVLVLDKDPQKSTRVGLLMRVNVQQALALPLHALDDPLIMLHVPRKGRGILNLEGKSPDHILADGNHRLARAFFEGRTHLKTHVLSQAQARKYLL